MTKSAAVFGVGLLSVLAATAWSGAQEAPKSDAKTAAAASQEVAAKALSLDEQLARALKDNPDIRVAESKVHDAQAELYRVRLQVTQKVVVARQALETQQKVLTHAERNLEVAKKQRLNGTVPAEATDVAAENLAREQAKQAELEAEMAFLLGRSSAGTARALPPTEDSRSLTMHVNLTDASDSVATAAASTAAQVGRWRESKITQRDMNERLRKALDAVTTVHFINRQLNEVLEEIQNTSGIALVRGPGLPDDVVNLQLPSQSWGVVFQALEDSLPNICFVPRDYGILVTTLDYLPPGATRLNSVGKATMTTKPANPGK